MVGRDTSKPIRSGTPCKTSHGQAVVVEPRIPPDLSVGSVNGVSWDKQTNKWKVQIQYHKRKISIGYFENKEDAIRARLNAEKKYFGEFSSQKHLFKEYGIELDE